jgi:hypothetical protein
MIQSAAFQGIMAVTIPLPWGITYYFPFFPLATLSAILITRIIGPMSRTGDYEALLSNIVGNEYSRMIQNLIKYF